MGFLDDTYLLSGQTARRLYHETAVRAPVVDFHNHLNPQLLLENRAFHSITEAWLDGDHYKWRAMRGAGIPEPLVSGGAGIPEPVVSRGAGIPEPLDPRGAGARERFGAWAATVPRLSLNPLYAWTHLELRRVLGISTLLNADTADQIFDQANERLEQPDMRPQELLKRFSVRVACTTDDPADPLDTHVALRLALPECRILPTFRPDRAMDVSDPRAFDAYLRRLSETSGSAIQSPASLLAALESRHTAFHEAGCRASDHGLEQLPSVPFDGAAVERVWQRVRAGRVPTAGEAALFRSWLLHELALLDHSRGWVGQYHLGAIRNLNSRRYNELGPDSGGDAIGLPLEGKDVARFLDSLDREGRLARTVLYAMRPADIPMLASVAGCFLGGDIPGKVQVGSAWWFSDTESGIRSQLRVLAEIGVLGQWVGMVTDSRSLFSLTRHEYFRRILCDEVGREVDRGLLPNDDALLVPLVESVCFGSAASFFGFDEDRTV